MLSNELTEPFQVDEQYRKRSAFTEELQRLKECWLAEFDQNQTYPKTNFDNSVLGSLKVIKVVVVRKSKLVKNSFNAIWVLLE